MFCMQAADSKENTVKPELVTLQQKQRVQYNGSSQEYAQWSALKNSNS